jgi:hypothetical protein
MAGMLPVGGIEARADTQVQGGTRDDTGCIQRSGWGRGACMERVDEGNPIEVYCAGDGDVASLRRHCLY